MTTEDALSQEQAFLSDICTNPDDDGVRLIYADWLTERDCPGDTERAEFIRVQCRLAALDAVRPLITLPAQLDRFVSVYALLSRERQLLTLVQDRLRQEWRSWADERKGPSPWWEGFQVHCGFVEHITLPAADWCRYAGRLLATQPIREVTLTTRLRISVHEGATGFVTLWIPGDPGPFRTLPLEEWMEPRFDPLEPGYTYSASMTLALWPGIVFHGPDFPETSS